MHLFGVVSVIFFLTTINPVLGYILIVFIKPIALRLLFFFVLFFKKKEKVCTDILFVLSPSWCESPSATELGHTSCGRRGGSEFRQPELHQQPEHEQRSPGGPHQSR